MDQWSWQNGHADQSMVLEESVETRGGLLGLGSQASCYWQESIQSKPEDRVIPESW